MEVVSYTIIWLKPVVLKEDRKKANVNPPTLTNTGGTENKKQYLCSLIESGSWSFLLLTGNHTIPSAWASARRKGDRTAASLPWSWSFIPGIQLCPLWTRINPQSSWVMLQPVGCISALPSTLRHPAFSFLLPFGGVPFPPHDSQPSFLVFSLQLLQHAEQDRHRVLRTIFCGRT